MLGSVDQLMEFKGIYVINVLEYTVLLKCFLFTFQSLFFWPLFSKCEYIMLYFHHSHGYWLCVDSQSHIELKKTELCAIICNGLQITFQLF